MRFLARAVLCVLALAFAQEASVAAVATGAETIQKVAAIQRPTTDSMTLKLSPVTQLLSSTEWNQLPKVKARSRDEQVLRYEVPYGGKSVTVEQRRYPILHASPTVLIQSYRQVMTRGLGRIHFDPDSNELVVFDQPSTHERLWRYHHAMDTATPARMAVVSSAHLKASKALLQKQLGAKGELISFEDEGVFVFRGEPGMLDGILLQLRRIPAARAAPAAPGAKAGLAVRPGLRIQDSETGKTPPYVIPATPVAPRPNK